jgi:hypothetical protein
VEDPYEVLDKMYNTGDESVGFLYKYRSCALHHLDCLRNDKLWFSNRSQLNDPFDCLVRLPERDCNLFDVYGVRENLANAKPYLLELSDPGEIVEYIGNTLELEPLVSLGLSAAQFGYESLLRHLRELHIESDLWVVELIFMARELVRFLLQDTTVFCVSEPNNNQLMWAHYAANHTGFCTGYVCPVRIWNPRIIDKVNYVEVPPTITDWQLIEDPGGVRRDLVLTKPNQWSYEAEWRIAFAGINGLLDNLLPYREVIFGARTSTADETRIREAVGHRDVRFYRAVPDHTARQFDIRIEPA